MAADSLFWYTNMAAVTSCENALYCYTDCYQRNCYVLDANEEETMELSICGVKAGNFASTLKCHVNYSTEPVYVHVKANFEVILCGWKCRKSLNLEHSKLFQFFLTQE